MTMSRVYNQTAGILLAGTHPWTRSAFDSCLPRTLLPVAHRPLISYGLSWLHRQGIRDVAVCGNRESRLLQSRLAPHVPPGMIVSYHEDRMPRGAAGSARDAALATDAHTFVVADGTSIPDVDLSDVLLKHHTSASVRDGGRSLGTTTQRQPCAPRPERHLRLPTPGTRRGGRRTVSVTSKKN